MSCNPATVGKLPKGQPWVREMIDGVVAVWGKVADAVAFSFRLSEYEPGGPCGLALPGGGKWKPSGL